MAEEQFFSTAEEAYYGQTGRLHFITANLSSGSVFETKNVQSRAAWCIWFAIMLGTVTFLHTLATLYYGIDSGYMYLLYSIFMLTSLILVPLLIKFTKSMLISTMVFIVILIYLNFLMSLETPQYIGILVIWLALYPCLVQYFCSNIYLSISIMILVYICQWFEIENYNDTILRMCSGCEEMQAILYQSSNITKWNYWVVDATLLLFSYAADTQQLNISRILNELLNQTKISVRTKDRFIAAMSYQLRNHLNSILGSIECIVRENHEGLSLDSRELLQTMQSCSEMLLNLINNILYVSKLQSGKCDLSETETDLRQLVSKLMKVVKTQTFDKGLDMMFRSNINLPQRIMCDNSRLTQVLINLISNAIKFTDKGRINVSIDYEANLNTIPANLIGSEPVQQILAPGIYNKEYISENSQDPMDSFDSYIEDDWQLDENAFVNFLDHRSQQVRNGSTQTSSTYPWMTNAQQLRQAMDTSEYCEYSGEECGFVRIHVEDTGIGLSEQAIEKLFKPFTESNRIISSEFGGTGIGLWISQNIMKILNGRITIKSKKGKGSVFTVFFPVRVPSQEMADNSSDSSSLNRIIEQIKGTRVLLAEDLPFNQQVMEKIITSIDCQCQIVTNGTELLETYKKSHTDVDFVLTDFEMPLLDGISACSEIRKFEKDNDLPGKPLALITGNDAYNTRKLASSAGVNMFMVKPLGRADLAKSLMKLLSKVCTKVLVIDDDDVWLSVTTHMLESSGIEVIGTKNPNEGLALAKNNWEEIDGLIVDYLMPDMNGIELLEHLRDWERSMYIGKIPAIVLSGHYEDEFLEKWDKAGVNEAIQKPTNRDQLVEAISNHFNDVINRFADS